jgi:hypothetical protein
MTLILVIGVKAAIKNIEKLMMTLRLRLKVDSILKVKRMQKSMTKSLLSKSKRRP